jgi:biotin carboxylase
VTEGALLVLGAARYQLDVIREAQHRGLRVVVADNIASNPGHSLADTSYVISTTDIDAIEGVARSESVRGIVAPCTDVAVPTAATVAARLGLPGAPPVAASVVTSKSAFRRWQRQEELPSPETYVMNGSTSSRPRGRLVVKPDRSSGSKGTQIIEGDRGIADAIRAARRFGDGVVVEQLIEGHHLTVEGLLRGGRLAWSLVLDRQTAPEPWCATTGHRIPTTLRAAEARRAVDAVSEIVQKLGLEEGPVDADLVIADDPVVLELSPRLGGNEIAPLAELASGVNLASAAIDAALGVPTPVPDEAAPSPSAVILLGTHRAGRLSYDEDEAKALSAEPWVARLELDPPGTSVPPFVEGRAAVGRALITAPHRSGIDSRAEEVVARIGVRAL